jgi:hypothetical protein
MQKCWGSRFRPMDYPNRTCRTGPSRSSPRFSSLLEPNHKSGPRFRQSVLRTGPNRTVASLTWLMDNLTEVLGRTVDVIPYLQNREMAYVHMEALLTTKTIWGDVSWLMTSRGSAGQMLRQGYARTKKAREMLSCVRETILSFEVCD